MITPRQLADMARLAVAEGLIPATCLDDDIVGAEPVLRKMGLNLYLVDSRQHCLRLTEDFQVATGVVLAEVTEECAES